MYGFAKRPVGVVVTLLVMVALLVVEPVLAWFIFPMLLLGTLVAAVLHSSKFSSDRQNDEHRAEIQIAKIPVKGTAGLLFTIGTMAIFFVALPHVRWFLVFALPAGALIGIGLHLWHKRHP